MLNSGLFQLANPHLSPFARSILLPSRTFSFPHYYSTFLPSFNGGVEQMSKSSSIP